MARSQNTFNKLDKEKKRLQKKKEKQQRKEERKNSSGDTSLEAMMAYVDENGNIIDTPPDPAKKRTEIDASEIEIGVPKKEEEDLTSERRGRVNFYDTSKGYGFINQDGTQERFFVHHNNIVRQIKEGDRVSFTPQKGVKGMEAIGVKPIN